MGPTFSTSCYVFSHRNLDELERVARRFSPMRVAVELRNRTWREHQAETFAALEQAGIAYVTVDEPQGFPSSVPPIPAATSPLAIVRLHGRNAARWSRKSESAAERFDYSYSEPELREWVPRVRFLAGRARDVHVLFNNCHGDKAVKNAARMKQLLDEAELHASV